MPALWRLGHLLLLLTWESAHRQRQCYVSCDRDYLNRKYLSPLILHRKGFVFKIFTWISVFRRRKNGLEICFLVPEISKKYKRSILFWDTLYNCGFVSQFCCRRRGGIKEEKNGGVNEISSFYYWSLNMTHAGTTVVAVSSLCYRRLIA